jgi:hypothetical protein
VHALGTCWWVAPLSLLATAARVLVAVQQQ